MNTLMKWPLLIAGTTALVTGGNAIGSDFSAKHINIDSDTKTWSPADESDDGAVLVPAPRTEPLTIFAPERQPGAPRDHWNLQMDSQIDPVNLILIPSTNIGFAPVVARGSTLDEIATIPMGLTRLAEQNRTYNLLGVELELECPGCFMTTSVPIVAENLTLDEDTTYVNGKELYGGTIKNTGRIVLGLVQTNALSEVDGMTTDSGRTSINEGDISVRVESDDELVNHKGEILVRGLHAAQGDVHNSGNVTITTQLNGTPTSKGISTEKSSAVSNSGAVKVFANLGVATGVEAAYISNMIRGIIETETPDESLTVPTSAAVSLVITDKMQSYLTNLGIITGKGGAAGVNTVSLRDTTGTALIDTFGVISSQHYAIDIDSIPTEVNNSGLMEGAVRISNTNSSRFNNTGTWKTGGRDASYIGGDLLNNGLIEIPQQAGGEYTITNQLMSNNGIIVVGSNKNPGTRLVINGNYTGGKDSELTLHAVLNEAESRVDSLRITGNNGPGDTKVNIISDGNGGQTREGIRVIEVDGKNEGSFTQKGRTVAGAFEYYMRKLSDANVWVLTSSLTSESSEPVFPEPAQPEPVFPGPVQPEPVPPGPVQPVPGPSESEQSGSLPSEPVQTVPVTPESVHIMRPEAMAYAWNLRLANTLGLTRDEQRAGVGVYTDAITGKRETSEMWMSHQGHHVRSKDSSGQLDGQSNTYSMQLGGTVWSRKTGDDGKLALGIQGGYGHASGNSHSALTGYRARSSLSGYNTGLYGTWREHADTQSGAYVSTSVLYGWYRNQVKGDDLAAEKYDSRGATVSLEGGYDYAIWQGGESKSDSLFIRPYAQVTWMGVKADEHREANGTRVTEQGDGNVFSRVSGRIWLDRKVSENQRVQPFVEASWLHNTRDFCSSMNGVRDCLAGDRNQAEVLAGVKGQVSPQVAVTAQAGGQFGGEGSRDLSGMLNVAVTF